MNKKHLGAAIAPAVQQETGTALIHPFTSCYSNLVVTRGAARSRHRWYRQA
jgi:hypothetical protein